MGTYQRWGEDRWENESVDVTWRRLLVAAKLTQSKQRNYAARGRLPILRTLLTGYSNNIYFRSRPYLPLSTQLLDTMGRKKRPVSAPKQRGWTTEAQEEYLKSHIPAVLTAQVKKKTAQVWPLIHDGWFAKFPLPPKTQDEIKDGIDDKTRIDRQKIVSCIIS